MRTVRRYVLQILTALGCRARNGIPELSVVLTGDDEVHRLNRDWRHKDKPTDVLSFSQIEDIDALAALGADGEEMRVTDAPEGCPEAQPVWGDVVISYDTAARQAAAFGHSLADEVRVLLVHGILHLLGHDHEKGGAQAARMRAEEARILALMRAQSPRSPGR